MEDLTKSDELVVFAGSDLPDIDYLTKLPNRYFFQRSMDKALKEAKSETAGYVILVNIDDFTMIIQGYGYDQGDFLIACFAEFLKKNFDSNYMLFRMNCDRFLLMSIKPRKPEQLNTDLAMIIKRFELPWSIGKESLYCTVNISAVEFPVNGRTVEEIYRNLDSAICRAKACGANNFVIYQEDMESISNITMKHWEIENMIRDSVMQNYKGFQVYYQPIYKANSEIIMGAEALLRFTNEAGIQIAPGHFIPLAERTGLIIPIGEFVLRTAARFCKEMIDAGYPDFCVTVNVSIYQWQKAGFLQSVIRILEEMKAPYQNIILEITESVAAINIERIYDTCQSLKKYGVQIALDDFGTGYSSLNMIRTMPIDMIKIDSSFVKDVVYDEYARVFMRLITELGHELGLSVCAEGVEKPKQLAQCKDIGVDYIQGYIFQPAISEAEFNNMMQNKHHVILQNTQVIYTGDCNS